MTRETKLGIGVAGTFLTLVGGWAGVKIYRGEAPTTPTENPAVAEAKADAAPPAAAQTETPAPAPVAVQPVVSAPPAAEPAPAIPTPMPAAITTPETAAPAPATANSGDAPPPPVMPLPVAPSPQTETSRPPTGNTDGAPPIMPAPITPPPADNASPPAANAAPPPALPSPTTNDPPAPAPITINPSPPAQDAPPPGPVPSPVIETKKDVEPPPTAVIITKPAEQPTPTVTVSPASGNSPATLGPPGGGLTSRPATETAGVRPPSEPRVQSYLEEEHHWQPGDNFAAVSQKYYFSDKYAAALQQYNREYPLATAGMRQTPPAMIPGQVIWVPPVRILERDHADLIADLKRLNDRGAPATPTARPAEPAGASSGFGNPRLYKVRERGETMYEIARRTLNDSGLWHLIHRLNPTLSRDPKLPIPAGTVLRLPPEAKLEPGDMPN